MIKRKSQDHDDCGCSRRVFMKKTMTGLGTMAFGSFAVPLIEGFSSPCHAVGMDVSMSTRNSGVSITVDISQTENRPLAAVGGTLALGRNDVDRKGILLYRESETTVKAFSRECAHLKCTVDPFIDGISTCPCHGSQYDLSGARIAGPARRGLHQYKTSINGNIITISP